MYTFYQFWTNFIAFFIAITLTPGIFVQDGLEGYIISGSIYSGMIIFLPNLIQFFKINVNLSSFILIGSIVSVGYYYFMRYILVGFLIFRDFSGIDGIFGLSYLKGFELTEIQVIIFAGIFTILVTAFNQWIIDN